MPSPWFLARRRSHLHGITSSNIHNDDKSNPEAQATMSIPEIELVAHLKTYVQAFHYSPADDSLTPLRTMLYDHRENRVVSNVVRFVTNGRTREDTVRAVLSFPGVTLSPSCVPRVTSYARNVVEEMEDEELVRTAKVKVEVTICRMLDIVYDEDVAMELAEIESEEAAARWRRRQLKVAKEITLEEKEWEGSMGTCTICLEEFCEGERVAQMPCSHNFHKNCVWKWLIEESNSCPLCRCVVE